jgi:hypothetical protein
LGAASAWPWEVVPVTRVLDGVGRYSGGITFAEAPMCFGKKQSLDDGRAERRQDGHVGSPEQTLSHS